MQTGKKRSSAGCTDGGAAVCLLVARALGGHLVQMRGLDQLLTVNTDVALGDVIAENKNEVWWALLGLGDISREH